MYRLNEQTGQVYEWSEKHQAYLFCGNLNGRSLEEFIADREERQLR